MVAVPAFLFYFLIASLSIFVLLAAVALCLAIALMASAWRLVQMARAGAEEARQGLIGVRDLFFLVTGL